MVQVRYTLGPLLSRDVFFSFGSSGYELGCTIAAVSAARAGRTKNAFKNKAAEQMPQSVNTEHIENET